MPRHLLRRLALLPLILLLTSLAIFLLPYLTGIDPTLAIIRARIGERTIEPAAVTQLRSELGLDRNLGGQYLVWISDVVRGDLGFSYVSRAPVGVILGRGVRVTAALTITTLTLALLLALPLGIGAARRPGSWLDLLIMVGCQAGVAIPQYVLAPCFILLFALWLGWLPSAGWRGPSFAVLPVLTLLPAPLAYFTQATRAALLDVFNADYMRTARAKGLGPGSLLYRHALRNALIPVATLVTLWLAGLLGGSVIVEVIFAVPGLGRILYDAVIAGDLPLVQAGLLLLVGLAIVISTLTDLLYLWLNPAMRLSQSR
ncbi:MAG: ABC transporter permease [Caldilineaceae bacterium]